MLKKITEFLSVDFDIKGIKSFEKVKFTFKLFRIIDVSVFFSPANVPYCNIISFG